MKFKPLNCFACFLTLFMSIGILHSQNESPQISNLRAEHIAVDNMVRIMYDLNDAEGEQVEISLLASNNVGQTYLVNTNNASGDIGFPVQSATGLEILWDYDDTISNILDYQIKLVADDRYEVDIQEIVDQVDTNQLKQNLQFIAQERHRNTGLNHLNNVKDTLETHFNKLGLQSSRQAFNYQGYNAHNIIGRLPGLSNEKTTYIIDAHFDGIAGSPAADDNGSGIAGVMEAARILSNYHFDNSIRFIGFDLEEAGLIGSNAYVNAGGIEEFDSIAGVFNYEMIGYYSEEPNSQDFPFGFNLVFPDAYAQAEMDTFKGDFITNVANEHSISIKTSFDSAAARYVPELEVVSLTVSGNGAQVPDLRRSDHANFWDAGHQALMLTDGANFRNPNYHKASDSLGTLNFSFMSNVIKATIGAVCEEAGINHSTTATALIEKRTSTEPEYREYGRLNVYPNPASDRITLHWNGTYITGKLTIVDNLGRIVMQQDLEMEPNGPVELDVSTFSPGIYYVEVDYDEGKEKQKIVVE